MPYFREKYGNIGKKMPYLFTRYDNKKEKYANLKKKIPYFKEKYAKLRNQAFDELRPLYTEYIKYARILLAGNQALEALGIVVKRK